MIVTIIADVLGEENNGTTIACMNLIRYLRDRGDIVKVVCCDQDKKDLPGYYVVPQMNLGHIINYALKKNQVTLSKPDAKIIEKAIEGSDVVHCMIPFALSRKAAKICLKKDIPVTAGFHCQAENFSSHIFAMNSRLVNYIVYQNFWHGLYKRVDAIHYPTQFIKDIFENAIEERTNGYVISNGVNDIFKNKPVEKPEELKDNFVILSTGRYSKEKAQQILIKAVKYSKYKDKIQLILAGKGPYRAKYAKLADKCGIKKPIFNFYSRDEVVDVINYSDLYVHTAEIELEGIACLEALKCGLVPLLANSSRSATKYFARDDNNLFKVNNYKELAKKIDFWIEHPELKEEYKQYYLQNTKVYDQKECMRETRQMLVETIRCKKNKHQRSYITAMN
ncbi:MAG: glycosyltransferase [Bacilli bacterium]|nr:glycosyltransferase [Bacilli bacterium]